MTKHLSVMGKGRFRGEELKSYRTLSWELRLGAGSLGMITIFLIFLIFLLYFFEVNLMVQKGLSINNLEERVVELKEENRSLKLELAKASSLDVIEEKVSKLGLVPVDKIRVINEDSQIALRE